MKTIGSYTTTDGLQITQMLIDGFEIIWEHSNEASRIWEDELSEDEQNDPDRFYVLATCKEGRTYACTGTVDIERYVEVGW